MNTDESLENLDRMLSTYFKAELPKTFPPLSTRADYPQPVRANGERNHSRSRWALAASVAMLLGGCWYLSGQMGSTTTERPNYGKGDLNAKMPKELLKANENLKNSTRP